MSTAVIPEPIAQLERQLDQIDRAIVPLPVVDRNRISQVRPHLIADLQHFARQGTFVAGG